MSRTAPQTATLAWFARHELRLFWRDWLSLLTAGKRRRETLLLIVAVLFLGGVQAVAYYMIAPFVGAGIAPDKTTLIVVSGSVLLYATMMMSQAMESVTRAFYARADLDLILTSPISSRRIFTVRMIAIAVSTTMLTTLLAGPFINALAMHDGAHWLAGYGVILALGALSTALALLLTIGLFHLLGPKRTRAIAQIVSAVIGAAFVIGIQAAAILSTGSISRFSVLGSERLAALTPDLSSALWWPARAAMGETSLLAAMLALGFGALVIVILIAAPRFGEHVIAAMGVAVGERKINRRIATFRPLAIKRLLRRKEWLLLRRDPWLLSQSLMQILYLLPPVLLLWRNFGDSIGGLLILVPILVMAAGQLAGGLAWLAVSGEDAPDLVASAPVSERKLIQAKIESVLGAVALVVGPLLLGLAFAAPRLAIVAAIGIAVSAGSATMIQIWFRAQAKRSNFRRRQTSSRIATLAEALSSIFWAGTAVLAATDSWLALATAIVALFTLAGTWAIRPRRAAAA